MDGSQSQSARLHERTKARGDHSQQIIRITIACLLNYKLGIKDDKATEENQAAVEVDLSMEAVRQGQGGDSKDRQEQQKVTWYRWMAAPHHQNLTLKASMVGKKKLNNDMNNKTLRQDMRAPPKKSQERR